MKLNSSAFEHEGMIPSKYTCDGRDVSPPLEWSGIPGEAKSLALISDDPDAPVGTWVHWVYYDIGPGTHGLPEAVAPDRKPAQGGSQGVNDFRRIGYGGPCPPSGTHRYFFRLYALDTVLNLEPGVDKKGLVKAMQGHVIARAELMGRYKRR